MDEKNNKNKKIVMLIFALFTVILIILAAATNPTKDRYISWLKEKELSQTNSITDKAIFSLLGPSFMNVGTNTDNYVLYSVFTTQIDNYKITVVGMFNNFITLKEQQTGTNSTTANVNNNPIDNTTPQQKVTIDNPDDAKSIVLIYNIDKDGNISTNYSNNSSILMKIGQTVELQGSVHSSSPERVLSTGTIMEVDAPNYNIIKMTSPGQGDITIVPNGYDWDRAFKLNIQIINY